MRIALVTVIVFFANLITAKAQIEKHTTQIGVSALPIYDVLNLFPENKVAGVGLLGNVGYFPIKNLSIGMQYIFSSVSNTYNVSWRFQERISVHALSAYSRYYLWLGQKVSIYPMASAGLGFMRTRYNDPRQSQFSPMNTNSSPIFIGSLGIGLNFQLSKIIAIELNLPYAHVDYLSDDTRFNTIAPTLGLQFFLGSD